MVREKLEKIQINFTFRFVCELKLLRNLGTMQVHNIAGNREYDFLIHCLEFRTLLAHYGKTHNF